MPHENPQEFENVPALDPQLFSRKHGAFTTVGSKKWKKEQNSQVNGKKQPTALKNRRRKEEINLISLDAQGCEYI